MPAGSVEGELPDGMKIQTTRAGLHVAPVTPDVKNVDKGQACHSLDRLLQRLNSFAYGEGRAIFFPGIADQPQAKVPDVGFGRRGNGERAPALILSDVKGTLIKPVGRGGER